MMLSRRWLAAAYVAVALAALILTWGQNLAYFAGGGGLTAFPKFLIDAAANPASRSVTFDILLIFYAAAIWMVFEARRLRMRFVWVYVILGLFVAISVTFPLFLAVRELRTQIEPHIEGRPSMADGVGIGALAVLVGYLCVFVLMRTA